METSLSLSLKQDMEMVGDFSSIKVSSKDIAEQTGKSHGNLIQDFKKISITMGGGEEIHKTSVNGGLSYSVWSKNNLEDLFHNIVEKKIDECKIIHPYFQGLTVERDDRGYVSGFTVNGDTALHILTKSDDKKRWDLIQFNKYLIKQNIELASKRVMGYMKPEINLTPKEEMGIFLKVTEKLTKAHGKLSDVPRSISHTPKSISHTSSKRGGNNKRGGKKGMRYLDLFDMKETDTFDIEEVSDMLHTTSEELLLELASWNLIDKSKYLDDNFIAEKYSLINKWMVETVREEYNYDYEMYDDVYGIEFTTKGVQHLCRRLISRGKRYNDTHCVKTVDMEEMWMDVPAFYKNHKM